ncbi:MAG TPA: primosomal protein N' [Gammaproteobacteria bacterium]|nr:primosomal protein N' [Gammaproteobacteria bacterium]
MSILKVAVPSPLSRTFDYLPPLGQPENALLPGSRLSVPFGRGRKVGILLGVESHSDLPLSRLRRADAILDPEPTLPSDLMHLARWASRYYHHPIGEVMSACLPTALRRLHDTMTGVRPSAQARYYQITEAGHAVNCELLKRAPLQRKLFNTLKASKAGCSGEQLAALGTSWRTAVRALIDRGLVVEHVVSTVAPREVGAQVHGRDSQPVLHDEQHTAAETLKRALGCFSVTLLEGVTGSGKTEVYLRLVQACLEQAQQVLILVPEIGLTPQLIERFRKRFTCRIELLHSGTTDRERLRVWQEAKAGQIQIVIGTRSAVFTPFKSLGSIIVDEEHDLSFKQQDGFRYHARDLAVIRGRERQCPVLLGSATPSLESLANVASGRYRHLSLLQRAGGAQPPQIGLLDVRRRAMHEGLSEGLLELIAEHLQQKGQILLFLNRRGFAPVLMCHDCGWSADCPRCDAHMTLHLKSHRLRCHHCGSERAVPVSCPECALENMVLVGQGTERIEAAIAARFPSARVIRIDRDNTRRKGQLESLLAQATAGEADILIGTQMLAKGHHFPRVTLVGILDVDRGLFSADFRATEHVAQLVVQVSGRAGREGRQGRVVIQTHQPDNPLLQVLVRQGYPAFARDALEERKVAELAPFNHLALLRAEATDSKQPRNYLQAVRAMIQQMAMEDVWALGPAVAPMERIAGRYRWQLLIQSPQRKHLHRLLDELRPALETLPASRKVRWSLDVDPVTLL